MNFEYLLARTELLFGEGVLENIGDKVSKIGSKSLMSLGRMRNSVDAQWPEHEVTFLHICRLLWPFSCQYLGFWLYAHRSFPKGGVGLLSWMISDINRVGGQEVF